MKIYEWKECDIVAGRTVCKPSQNKPFEANGWTAKHTYKIGWIAGNPAPNICLISMTDGMIDKEMTDAEMAVYLNEGGFVPMEHKHFMKVMDYLSGCYDNEIWLRKC